MTPTAPMFGPPSGSDHIAPTVVPSAMLAVEFRVARYKRSNPSLHPAATRSMSRPPKKSRLLGLRKLLATYSGLSGAFSKVTNTYNEVQ